METLAKIMALQHLAHIPAYLGRHTLSPSQFLS
jgi:hypothetical protein